MPYIGAFLTMVVAACGIYEPKPEAAPTPPLQPPATADESSRTDRTDQLDAYGNLRASDVQVFGFDLPMGAEASGRGLNRFIGSDDKRFERFFRSRGYRLESKAYGAFTIRHSRRTLDRLTAEDAQEFENAAIFARPGPGAGFTMRFNRGRPAPRPDILAELREAERFFDPAFKRAQKRYRQYLAAQKQASKVSAPESTATPPTFGGKNAGATQAAPSVPPPKPEAKGRTFTPEDLKILRRKASARLKTPRAKALQKKILEWERKTGKTFYD